MNIDLSQFIQTFFEETHEHLVSMEALLLELDVSAPDAEQLNAVFRAAHSIKGGAATFGFADLTDVTHILENQLDRVRKGTLALRADMVDTFLEAGDALKSMLQTHQSGQEPDPEASAPVCEKLRALEGAEPKPLTAACRWRLQILHEDHAPGTYHKTIQSLQNAGWVLDESDPTANSFLSVNNDTAENITETLEFIFNPGDYQLSQIEPDIGADFGFFEPLNADIAEEGDGFGLFAPLDNAPTTFATNLIEEGDGFGLFAPLTAAEINAPQAPQEVAVKPTASAKPAKETAQNLESSSIRVGVEKVDHIINLVGELVITQAMLAQAAIEIDPALHERLHSGIAMLERNTRELQESAMSIRMMPISFVFSRFPRVVRDTAAKLNKKVKLVTHGENTELDRGLIEKLADPLTHLVRNSLDHGIENAEVRQAKGKPEEGTLTLKAFHQGGNIIVQVLDDGAGLNRERILAKAKSQGMNVHDGMTDAEIWPLIFEAGFSTAEVITDVSGRGVGMDVVRRNIQSMGGRIDIDSTRNVGTTMTIRLPLTLAILDGMAIQVGEEVYVIPLGFIVESLQPNTDDIKTVSSKGRVVHVRGEYLPIISLHEAFGMDEHITQFNTGLFVILESDAGKTALYVDDLLGQHQVVIKSLESNFRKVPGVSGATIMGDGRVALIIDVESLVRLSQEKAKLISS